MKPETLPDTLPEYRKLTVRMWLFLVLGLAQVSLAMNIFGNVRIPWIPLLFAPIAIWFLYESFRARKILKAIEQGSAFISNENSREIECEISSSTGRWLASEPYLVKACAVRSRPLAMSRGLGTRKEIDLPIIRIQDPKPGASEIMHVTAYFRGDRELPFLIQKNDFRVWLAD